MNIHQHLIDTSAPSQQPVNALSNTQAVATEQDTIPSHCCRAGGLSPSKIRRRLPAHVPICLLSTLLVLGSLLSAPLLALRYTRRPNERILRQETATDEDDASGQLHVGTFRWNTTASTSQLTRHASKLSGRFIGSSSQVSTSTYSSGVHRASQQLSQGVQSETGYAKSREQRIEELKAAEEKVRIPSKGPAGPKHSLKGQKEGFTYVWAHSGSADLPIDRGDLPNLPEDRSPDSPTWNNSVAICAIMKEENAKDVREWLLYHRCAA